MSQAITVPMEHICSEIANLPAGGVHDFPHPENSATVRLVDIETAPAQPRTVAVMGAGKKLNSVLVMVEREDGFRLADIKSRQLTKIYKERKGGAKRSKATVDTMAIAAE